MKRDVLKEDVLKGCFVLKEDVLKEDVLKGCFKGVNMNVLRSRTNNLIQLRHPWYQLRHRSLVCVGNTEYSLLLLERVWVTCISYL